MRDITSPLELPDAQLRLDRDDALDFIQFTDTMNPETVAARDQQGVILKRIRDELARRRNERYA